MKLTFSAFASLLSRSCSTSWREDSSNYSINYSSFWTFRSLSRQSRFSLLKVSRAFSLDYNFDSQSLYYCFASWNSSCITLTRISSVLYLFMYSWARISFTYLACAELSYGDPRGIRDLSKSPMVILLNSLIKAVAWPSNFFDYSIWSYFYFNFFTTSSFFSLALNIRFYNDIFGAIELKGARQNGHFFLTLAYVLIHYLQNVCPHGNSIKGWLSGGKNSSKQIGQVLDITYSCNVSSISSPLFPWTAIYFCPGKSMNLYCFINCLSLFNFCSSRSCILINIWSIISFWLTKLCWPYYFMFIYLFGVAFEAEIWSYSCLWYLCWISCTRPRMSSLSWLSSLSRIHRSRCFFRLSRISYADYIFQQINIIIL